MAFNTTTLEVPANLFHHYQRISLDIGGSLAKAVYYEEDKVVNKAYFHLATFSRDDLDVCLKWLNEKCEGNTITPEVFTTGLGCYQFKERIEKALNTRLNNIFESGYMINATHFLAKTIPINEFLEPPSDGSFEHSWNACAQPMLEAAAQFNAMLCDKPNDQTIENVESQKVDVDAVKKQMYEKMVDTSTFSDKPFVEEFPNGFPAMLTTIGSGTSFSLLKPDGTGKALYYSSSGGQTLYGLAKLLTGVESFDAFVDLAKQGNSSNVDLMTKDFKTNGADGMYSLMPDGTVCFAFGKVMSEPAGTKFNKADIARALLSKFAAEHALNSAFAAECQQANVVFFIGTTIMDQVTKDEISKYFLENITMNNLVHEKENQNIRHFFIKNGSYLGAIGALLAGSSLRNDS